MRTSLPRAQSIAALPQVALAAVCLLAVAAAAQEEGVWQTIFRGETEVNLVNVEVAVSDRDGNPVTGLTAADFELAAGGEAVPISNFYAVEGGRVPETPAAAPGTEAPATLPAERQPALAERQLSIVVFVDNDNLRASHRARVFRSLREFLIAHRRQDARVMVASQERGHGLKVHQGFTSVPHDLFVTLDEIEESGGASPRFDLEWGNLIRAIESFHVDVVGQVATRDFGSLAGSQGDEADGTEEQEIANTAGEVRSLLMEIEAYTAERMQHVRGTLRVLEQLVEMASGLPGRKVVLYVSDGLPMRPGEALLEAFTQRFDSLTDVRASVSAQVANRREDGLDDFLALTERANAGGVTFYALDAAPLGMLTQGTAQASGARGGNLASFARNVASTEARSRQEPLRLVAQQTGGRVGLRAPAFGGVLDGIFADFDNYYSLGFSADLLPAKGKSDLEVRVRGRKNLEVRHRKSFRRQSVEERAVARTRAALLAGAGRAGIDRQGPENPLRVRVESQPETARDDGNFVVPLKVTVPLGKLVLLPGKLEHQGRVSMFVAVRDELGRTSEVAHHLCPIRIPNAQVLTALGQSAACGLQLIMRGGPQTVAVSVLDEVASVQSTVSLTLDVGETRASLDEAADASR